MYYGTSIDLMSHYQKLIHCWSIIFERRRQVLPLDNMNFNRQIFSCPLDVGELTTFMPFEPGYYSPDASSELDQLVRFYELNRLNKLAPKDMARNHQLIAACGIGFGNGTSNVVFNILRALIDGRKGRAHRPNVVIALPNYPVYYSQLLSLDVDVRIIGCLEENCFLPTIEQIQTLCDENTAAVLVTFPNNPSQQTYGSDMDFQKLLDKFAQNDTFLVVDNIYREMCWDESKKSLEVLLSVTSPKNWVVAYGPSKDTPFMSGYRLGYWIGDPSLTEKYRELVSASENCLNALSVLMFAVFLLFKGLSLKGAEQVSDVDVELLAQGSCGWSVQLDVKEVVDLIERRGWYQKFKHREAEGRLGQSQALKKIIEYLRSSRIFGQPINDNIGNLILTGVKKEVFKGDSFQLFEWALTEPKVGILPGCVFGLEEIRDDSIPFRITTIHDTPEKIITGLERFEKALIKG